MKKTTLFVVLLTCSTILTHAQFYKSAPPSEGFNDSLSKIVIDFKNNFYPIQGKQLTSEGMVDVYQSNVRVPGAEHCVIQRYHSNIDTTASWQAIMYDGESFEEAAKIYKNTYQQIKKARLTSGPTSYYQFFGKMENPEETLRFTVSQLKLNTRDTDYQYFYAEVEMTNKYSGWEVHLNLHSRKNDDEKY